MSKTSLIRWYCNAIVRLVQDLRVHLDSYYAISLKQWSTDRHLAAFGHVNLIWTQSNIQTHTHGFPNIAILLACSAMLYDNIVFFLVFICILNIM